MNNKLIIAAAGSGKTTFLVKMALAIKDKPVLITTYTQANEIEIRKKIIELNKYIPANITVQTWFSFLLQHGVRPYQGCLFEKNITGLILVNSQSAVKYVSKGISVCYREDDEFEKHYFTNTFKIYSDKLSKFVVRCNKKANGAVIERLTRIYRHILIDEIQDLAGYDLEFLKLLFKAQSNIFMVGDPRQVTYLTHNERKYSKYTNGLIKDFISTECPKNCCEVNEDTLNTSHRNNAAICKFSSLLYPDFKACISNQNDPLTGHDGVFLVKKQDAKLYLEKYNPVQLRLNKETKDVNPNFDALNFGESKGLSFDRVIIYPTGDMIKWLKSSDAELADKTRAQFYVAATRARYSVAIIFDYQDDTIYRGTNKYPTLDDGVCN